MPVQQTGGNVDEMLFFVNSLEKKVTKKFEFITERIKKIESESEDTKEKTSTLQKKLANFSYTPDELYILIQKLDDKLKELPKPEVVIKPIIQETKEELNAVIEAKFKEAMDILKLHKDELNKVDSSIKEIAKESRNSNDNELQVTINKNSKKLAEFQREFNTFKEFISKKHVKYTKSPERHRELN